MIAYIKWRIIEIEANKILILTDGWVWYELFVSSMVLWKIEQNKEFEFFVYHHITEATQSLFAFLDKIEKMIFEELIKISWIWWKVAIQILSLWVNTLISAISNEDKKLIESIKWIWKEMAEKIILELKDKDFVKNNVNILSENKKDFSNLERSLESDIISTLTNMWYSKQSIEKAILKISPELKTMQEIIPAIIKEL